MNVTVVDTIKHVITYLETKAIAPYADLSGNIFTGPNEERDNNTKRFITIIYEYVALEDELGDSTAKYEITLHMIMGYRIDGRSLTGTEKELGDTYFETFTRYLRSMQFKEYMAGVGVMVPPAQQKRGWRDMFTKEFEGVMKFNLDTILWTFINTLEDIP